MLDAGRYLWLDDSGTSSVEYALLVAVIAVGMIATWQHLAQRIAGALHAISDQLETSQ